MRGDRFSVFLTDSLARSVSSHSPVLGYLDQRPIRRRVRGARKNHEQHDGGLLVGLPQLCSARVRRSRRGLLPQALRHDELSVPLAASDLRVLERRQTRPERGVHDLVDIAPVL